MQTFRVGTVHLRCAGSCTLSNPTTAQSKSACTNRAVDTGSQCWTNRAYVRSQCYYLACVPARRLPMSLRKTCRQC